MTDSKQEFTEGDLQKAAADLADAKKVAEDKRQADILIELASDAAGAALTEANDRSPNTYTHGMMSDLDDAIIKARFDDDVSCIVLTGNGSSFFSAGASIQMLNSVSPGFKYNFCLHANETLSRLEQTPKLVVCAINGHAVGGGLEIAMAADILSLIHI